LLFAGQEAARAPELVWMLQKKKNLLLPMEPEEFLVTPPMA
jgi:hypothetical protein